MMTVSEGRLTQRQRLSIDLSRPLSMTTEQVKFARLLSMPGFLRAATDPDNDATQRSALVAKAVETVIPARPDADPWRATNRVWTAITYLTARRRDARIYGVLMSDTYDNILRLI